jgi:predicted ATPase
MDFIKEQSKEKQIIMTTHSPEVLNILEKDELDRIIVTRFDGENGTQMHHLSKKQKKKGQAYMNKIGHLSAFWLHSNLEKYDETEDK